MLTRNDLKNTTLLVGAEGISRGLAFVLTIMIARELGVVAFGMYSAAVSFVFLFSVFIEIGLSTYVFREVAQDEERTSHCIVNALTIQSILAVTIGIVVFCVAAILRYPSDTRATIALLWIWVVGISLGRLIRVLFKARRRMGLEAITNIFENATRLILVLLALKLDSGVIGIAIASVISAIFMTLMSFLIAHSHYSCFITTPTVASMLKMLKFASPFALSIIANVMMYRLSTIILSVLKGDYAVGIFDASFKITMSLFFIPGLLCQVFFSKMSQYALEDHNKFFATILLLVKYVFLLMYPFLIGLFIFAPQIIPVIYTEEYRPTIIVLQILIWVNVFNAGTYIGVYALNAAGYEKRVMKVMFLGVTIKAIISGILIAWLGYIGAAIAALFSELVVMSSLLYYLHHKIVTNQLKPILAKIVGVIVVSFGGVMLSKLLHLDEFIVFGLFAGLFIAACWILGLITPKSIKEYLPAAAR